MSYRRLGALLGVLVCVALASQSDASAQETPQTILGPGLYIFQTRTRSATCNDDERDGYVSTFVAPIHGVPGSRTMRMQLTNSEYWGSWTLAIDARNHIIGDARVGGSTSRSSHFEVSQSRDRFTGTGYREYMSGSQRCRVEYDALLKQINF